MYQLRQLHLPARPRVAGGGYRWHPSSGHAEVPLRTAAAPKRVGRRIASFSLAAVALFAAASLSALPASASGIFVRSANPANEADLVTEGANHTLQFYFATPGSPFTHGQVAGPGTTYSG